MGLGSGTSQAKHTTDFDYFSKTLGKNIWVEIDYTLTFKTSDGQAKVLLCDITSIFAAFSEDLMQEYENNIKLQREVKDAFLNHRAETIAEDNKDQSAKV